MTSPGSTTPPSRGELSALVLDSLEVMAVLTDGVVQVYQLPADYSNTVDQMVPDPARRVVHR